MKRTPCRRSLLFPAMLALGLLMAGCGASGAPAMQRVDPADIRRQISDGLQAGASGQEAITFLKDHLGLDAGIEMAGDYSYLREEGVPPNAEVVVAIIRNSSQGFLTRGDILIYLILGDGRYTGQLVVREVFTGL